MRPETVPVESRSAPDPRRPQRTRRAAKHLPGMNIRAVTFDVGGTLIEPWPSVGHVYAGVAARFGVNNIAPERLTGNFMHAWKARAGFDYSRESWYTLVRETFGEAAVRLPAEFFPAVYDGFAEASIWRVFDDVFATLDALTRRGLKLGVISNWDERLRPLLARLGLARYFSSLIISCEVGATKPDPSLFRQAAAELAVAPHELLHVGDNHTTDVLGAEVIGAAGRQVVRCNGALETWQIRSLLEIDALAADSL